MATKPRMRWQRYRGGVRTANDTARFLIGGKVVFSGYAPDPKLNRLLCKLFNAQKARRNA